jgi:hypothetical protein
MQYRPMCRAESLQGRSSRAASIGHAGYDDRLFVCMQTNTGAGSLAANSVGAAGGYGGGATGGAIPARGRKLQQWGQDGPHGGPHGGNQNNNWSPSPSGVSSGVPCLGPALSKPAL